MTQLGFTTMATQQPCACSQAWRALLLERQNALWERVREVGVQPRTHLSDLATYILGDARQWLAELPPDSVHAVVTDPPYGMIEYEEKHQEKLREEIAGLRVLRSACS